PPVPTSQRLFTSIIGLQTSSLPARLPPLSKLPQATQGMIRATDAKEVGVGNPAEETCRSPNHQSVYASQSACQLCEGLGNLPRRASFKDLTREIGLFASTLDEETDSASCCARGVFLKYWVLSNP